MVELLTANMFKLFVVTMVGLLAVKRFELLALILTVDRVEWFPLKRMLSTGRAAC